MDNVIGFDEDAIRLIIKHTVVTNLYSCYDWRGSKTSEGYPTIQLGGRYGPKITAHSLVCEWFNGPKPCIPSCVAMHRCNNSSCINPRHVIWGTQSENVKQSYRDGRR